MPMSAPDRAALEVTIERAFEERAGISPANR